MPGAVPDDVKTERWEQLMEVARDVSAGQLAKKVGRTIDVLVDDVRPEEKVAIARSQWDAPEIDGTVIISDAENIAPGQMVSVTVTASDEYDLYAKPAAAE